MKELLAIIALGILSWVAFQTNFQTTKIRDLDGVILTDNVGHYYRVRGNIGETVFLEELHVEAMQEFK
jgi:hypothetical protein